MHQPGVARGGAGGGGGGWGEHGPGEDGAGHGGDLEQCHGPLETRSPPPIPGVWSLHAPVVWPTCPHGWVTLCIGHILLISLTLSGGRYEDKTGLHQTAGTYLYQNTWRSGALKLKGSRDQAVVVPAPPQC